MEKIIDPISDLGFKFLFGREKMSEPVLRDLLNALLSGSEGFEEITSVTYLNNERTAEWKDGKSIRYDILCQTESKKSFIVEMQKASQPKFVDRATFYVSRGGAGLSWEKGRGEEMGLRAGAGHRRLHMSFQHTGTGEKADRQGIDPRRGDLQTDRRQDVLYIRAA